MRMCKNCVYADNCKSNHVCDDFYPADGNLEDIVIEKMIEFERTAFRKEWHQYITGFNS